MTRLADVLGRALAEAFECEHPLALVERDAVLGKLLPARDEEPLLLLRCEIAVGGAEPWKLLLGLRESELARLAGEGARNAPGDRRRPDAAPFAGIPLPISVSLADMTIPVSRIAALKPGDMLSLTLRGEAPLRLAGVEIARGQIGADGGCMALRLTTIAWNKRSDSHDG